MHEGAVLEMTGVCMMGKMREDRAPISKKTKLHSLFPSVVYERELSLNIKRIHNYCSKLKKSVKSEFHSNQGGWQSPRITLSDLPELSSEIEKDANIFKRTFLFKKPLKISNMWVSINNYKDYNMEHSHPHSILSGVYYVKVPKDGGLLRFINPSLDIMSRDWSETEKENYNNYNAEHWLFKPKENILFLFPGWLRHSVLPHSSKTERVSLSFNLK